MTAAAPLAKRFCRQGDARCFVTWHASLLLAICHSEIQSESRSRVPFHLQSVFIVFGSVGFRSDNCHESLCDNAPEIYYRI